MKAPTFLGGASETTPDLDRAAEDLGVSSRDLMEGAEERGLRAGREQALQNKGPEEAMGSIRPPKLVDLPGRRQIANEVEVREAKVDAFAQREISNYEKQVEAAKQGADQLNQKLSEEEADLVGLREELNAMAPEHGPSRRLYLVVLGLLALAEGPAIYTALSGLNENPLVRNLIVVTLALVFSASAHFLSETARRAVTEHELNPGSIYARGWKWATILFGGSVIALVLTLGVVRPIFFHSDNQSGTNAQEINRPIESGSGRLLITSYPSPITPAKTGDARISFEGSGDAPLKCQLDDRRPTRCFGTAVYSDLSEGAHTFTASQEQVKGKAAAAVTWEVKKPFDYSLPLGMVLLVLQILLVILAFIVGFLRAADDPRRKAERKLQKETSERDEVQDQIVANKTRIAELEGQIKTLRNETEAWKARTAKEQGVAEDFFDQAFLDVVDGSWLRFALRKYRYWYRWHRARTLLVTVFAVALVVGIGVAIVLALSGGA